MKLTRRSLFGVFAAAIASPWFPTLFQRAAPIQSFVLNAPTDGYIGGIERSTFPFWRNQQNHNNAQPSDEAMREAFNSCEKYKDYSLQARMKALSELRMI